MTVDGGSIEWAETEYPDQGANTYPFTEQYSKQDKTPSGVFFDPHTCV